MGYEKFNACEVLDLIGIPYDQTREEIKIPCPSKCSPPRKGDGHLKGDLFLNLSSGKCQCFRCGFTGNPTSIYAETYGITTKEAYIEILKRLGRWQEKGQFKKEKIERDAAPAPVRVEKPRLPDEAIAKTMRELFSILTLSTSHKEALLARGISKESIESEMYRSYPQTSSARHAVVATLKERGCQLIGVPGFYEKDGKTKMSVYSSGVLIPYRNAQGSILSAQIRLDQSSGCRYLLFSSSDEKLHPNGTKGRVGYHLCGEPQDDQTLMITEGALKARAIVDLLGGNAWVMAIPGVTMTRDIGKYIDDAAKIAPIRNVLVAFDMDEAINRNVQKARAKLDAIMKQKELRVGRLVWDAGRIAIGYNFMPISDELRKSPKEAIVKAIDQLGLTEQSDVSFQEENGLRGVIRVSPKHPGETIECGKKIMSLFETYEKAYNISIPTFKVCLDGKGKGLDDYLLHKKQTVLS